ncbi:MAG TPA: hypothetical protein PKI78_01230 [Anaerolineales bacterium]|nr:hypothetical protein [Anaerolineales bacterium]HNO30377.1 hypothetical protein [Anaerolineales bacterium]
MDDKYSFDRLGEYTALLAGYSWLEVETYLINNLEEGYNHDVFFSALLRDKLYQRSYQVPRVLDKGYEIHGPFYLSKLNSENFKKITIEQFSVKINDIFYSEVGFTKNDEKIDIARQQEARWLLNKLPKDWADYYELNVSREDEKYHHESWFILTIFYEFIIVERSTKKLYLCILGED